jgi:hypothetical protein
MFYTHLLKVQYSGRVELLADDSEGVIEEGQLLVLLLCRIILKNEVGWRGGGGRGVQQAEH